MQIFFLLVPIIAGAYRYRQLDLEYRLLFYSSCLSLFNLLLYFFFKDIPGNKLSPFWNNIFNYATLLCWLPIFVFVTLSWASVRKQLLITLAFVLFCIASMLAEAYLIGLEEIRASHAISLSTLLAIIIFIFTLNELASQQMLLKTRRSKLLIIAPFLFGSTFVISLDLFMYYLFSEQTSLLFQRLFYCLMWIGAATYLCTALSIWWAPKKEVFI
jgi:hypothetical protein